MGAGFYRSFQEVPPQAQSSHRSPDLHEQSVFPLLRPCAKILAHHLGPIQGLREGSGHDPHELRAWVWKHTHRRHPSGLSFSSLRTRPAQRLHLVSREPSTGNAQASSARFPRRRPWRHVRGRASRLRLWLRSSRRLRQCPNRESGGDGTAGPGVEELRKRL